MFMMCSPEKSLQSLTSNIKTAFDLKPLESCRIKEIKNSSCKRTILELGILPGQDIKKLDLYGERIYLIRGSKYSLSTGDIDKLIVLED